MVNSGTKDGSKKRSVKTAPLEGIDDDTDIDEISKNMEELHLSNPESVTEQVCCKAENNEEKTCNLLSVPHTKLAWTGNTEMPHDQSIDAESSDKYKEINDKQGDDTNLTKQSDTEDQNTHLMYPQLTSAHTAHNREDGRIILKPKYRNKYEKKWPRSYTKILD